jgi:CDP-4-dehydro-6-deoxyglucose reductase
MHMSSRITFRPSGHRFTAEPGETILSAALRAGLSPRYNCDNGSCGECRARVLSGELGPVDFHDCVLSEADKLAGITLLCCAHAAGDLELQTEEASHASDIPVQRISAKISRVEQLNDRASILHVRAPRSQVFRFLAGQHVYVQLGDLPPRELPVASCPCNGLQLQFHLMRDPQDPFLRHVFELARCGDPVQLQGPVGGFVLDEEGRSPITFVAWENGFAPINSLIEHAIALELSNPMTLYWAAADDEGLYLQRYCRSWADALDNFRFVPLVDGRQGAGTDPVAVLHGPMLQDGGLAGSETYAAVPAPAVPELRKILESTGLSPESIHIDPL